MTEAERYVDTTPFESIYKAFRTLTTDEMYLEWTQEETEADLQNILLICIPKFQFPRFKLYDYDLEKAEYNFILTLEEINIFANLMIVEWISRQLATTDITRQRYSSEDFSFTSQANHMSKLNSLKSNFEAEGIAMQRLYKRRYVDSNGYIRPNYDRLGGKQNAY